MVGTVVGGTVVGGTVVDGTVVDGGGGTTHVLAAPGVPWSPRDPYSVTDVHQLAATLLSAESSRSDADDPEVKGSGRSTVHVTRSTHTSSASSNVTSSSLLVSGKSAPNE